MQMQTRLAVVADRDVADRAQDFALLLDLDLLIGLLVEVEPSDGRLLEGADRRQRSRRDAGLVRKFRQSRERFLSGVQDDDAGFGTRVARYLRALHGSGRAALGVTAFLDLFDDLAAEGFEVARIARRDDPLVDDDLGVLPFGAGVGDVGLDRLERRHPAPLGDPGLDQQPRRVAHCRDDLLGAEDILDELERLGFDAKQVRIDLATGQDDRVVVAGRDLVERFVDLHGAAPILLVPALDFARRQRHDVHRRPRLLQTVLRYLEFGLFETVSGQDCDLFAVDIHTADPFLLNGTSFLLDHRSRKRRPEP